MQSTFCSFRAFVLSIVTLLTGAFCASGLGQGVSGHEVSDPSKVLYLSFEGDVPHPPPDAASDIQVPVNVNMGKLKSVFGPVNPNSNHLYCYGVGWIPLLTRSTSFLENTVEDSFDMAEAENVPIMFHIDPMYGFEADTEHSSDNAPQVKYWQDPEMREWVEFPIDGKYPTHIPRVWFNWGSWVSPAPAVPAFASPKFIKFASDQLSEGVVKPIARRIAMLHAAGKDYLFAGISIGWETSMFRNVGIQAANPPVASGPAKQAGVKMQPWEIGAQLGYASLFWKGYDQKKLEAEAQKKGVSTQAEFDEIIFHVLHDYMETYARICADNGLPSYRVYTHIVPMTTVGQPASSTTPPIWVSVNKYATPGFTLDNKGAAVYNMAVLKQRIGEADPQQHHFVNSESYLANYRSEKEMTDLLHEMYDNGCLVKMFQGAFMKGTPFMLDPVQEKDTLAMTNWLKAGVAR